MANRNRLLVTENDSFITEERRIEERIIELRRHIAHLDKELGDSIKAAHWHAVGQVSRKLYKVATELWVLDYRLQDVKEIIATFARIQKHSDRIEETGHGTG